MTFRYFHDPDTDLPHIYGHGVTEEEGEYVVCHSGEILRGRRGSRIALGQTANGRYLQVVYSPDSDGEGVFVISAYPLTGKPLKAYRRNRRRGKT